MTFLSQFLRTLIPRVIHGALTVCWPQVSLRPRSPASQRSSGDRRCHRFSLLDSQQSSFHPPCSTETVVPVVTDDLLTATARGHFAALLLLKLSVVCGDPRCLCPASGHNLLHRPSQSCTKLTIGHLHPVPETVLDVGLRTRMRQSVHLNGSGRVDDCDSSTARQSSDAALALLSPSSALFPPIRVPRVAQHFLHLSSLFSVLFLD